jgi:hypothetical protein
MKRLVALFVAVAVAVVLAGLFVPSPAATVGGSSISRQSLDSDLSAIAGSADYTCFLSEERQLAQRGQLPFLGAGTASVRGGVYDTTFVDDWLGSMITNRVEAQVAAGRGLRLTADDVSVAESILSRRITGVLGQYARDVGSEVPGCGGTGRAVLSSLPRWFVTEQSRAEADQLVLAARAAGAGLGGAAVAAYFRAHRTAFDRDCLSVIVLKTLPTAARVERALAGGSTFAAEAASASETPSSAAHGGVVGCGVLAGSFLSSSVAALRIGTPSEPLNGEGAYWIVEVTSRKAVPLSSVRSTVITAIVDAGQARADAELTASLEKTAVTVDPRYGAVSARHVTLVLPPAVPPVTALVSEGADQPVLTAASS